MLCIELGTHQNPCRCVLQQDGTMKFGGMHVGASQTSTQGEAFETDPDALQPSAEVVRKLRLKRARDTSRAC